MQLQSPHKFHERLLFMGGGGAGKTTAVLSIARVALPPGATMYVLDNDESYAYQRALETDFADIADRVQVTECAPEWGSFTEALAEVIEQADEDKGDWLVVDSISPAWDFVQAYTTELIIGTDIATHMAGVRREAENLSAFHKQMMDSVPWQIVKKEYARLITVPLRHWQGHLILTAEQKKLGKSDLEDSQLRDWFQTIGVKPAGEGRLPYITSTIMHLEHVGKKWKMTSVKDRNRELVEHKEFEDFGMEYLVELAGWTPVRKAKVET